MSYSKRTSTGNGTHANYSESGVSYSYSKGPVTINTRGDMSLKTPVKGVSFRNGHINARRTGTVAGVKVTASRSGVSLNKKLSDKSSISSDGTLSIKVPLLGGRKRINILSMAKKLLG